MGAVYSDYYEVAPPAPARSTVFVVRNGRYELQNLMPVPPIQDVLDFDGFIVHRPGANGGPIRTRPPEMRQASLVKNPVSVRRDSAKLVVREHDHGNGAPGEACLSLKFDAHRAGKISVHLLVQEVEVRLAVDAGSSISAADDAKTAGSVHDGGLGFWNDDASERLAEKPANLGTNKIIELLPQSWSEDSECAGDYGVVVETKEFLPGLDQCYTSPPIPFAKWPAEYFAFDEKHPKHIPIAVRLEVETLEDERSSVHYTYISLSGGGASVGSSRTPHIFSQKLQHGQECFVLHEVFGVAPKAADVDSGNLDCVICLSEPRDTAVLPCRHMCFCSYCAGIVRLQCDRCPVCRQKVASLLQFKRGQGTEILADTSVKEPDKSASTACQPPLMAGSAGSACDHFATSAQASMNVVSEAAEGDWLEHEYGLASSSSTSYGGALTHGAQAPMVAA